MKNVSCCCREKRSTMAEIVEQVQEREAAHVSLSTVFCSYFGHLFKSPCITFFPLCDLRQEESRTGLLAASRHPLLDLMGVPVLEIAPSQEGGLAQKNQRRHDVLDPLRPLVPQQHLNHLHTLPTMKASCTAKRPPPLTLKLSREVQTGA